MVELSRRRLLQSGAVLALGAAVEGLRPIISWAVSGGGTTAPGPGTTTFVPSATVRTTWTPYQGGTFTMRGPNGSLNVSLAEIADLQPAQTADDPNRFSLMFQAPEGIELDQGIYTLANSGLSTALFVVPVDRGEAASHFQAIINAA